MRWIEARSCQKTPLSNSCSLLRARSTRETRAHHDNAAAGSRCSSRFLTRVTLTQRCFINVEKIRQFVSAGQSYILFLNVHIDLYHHSCLNVCIIYLGAEWRLPSHDTNHIGTTLSLNFQRCIK